MNAQMDTGAAEMPGAQILWGVTAAPVTRDTQAMDFIAMVRRGRGGEREREKERERVHCCFFSARC